MKLTKIALIILGCAAFNASCMEQESGWSFTKYFYSKKGHNEIELSSFANNADKKNINFYFDAQDMHRMYKLAMAENPSARYHLRLEMKSDFCVLPEDPEKIEQAREKIDLSIKNPSTLFKISIEKIDLSIKNPSTLFKISIDDPRVQEFMAKNPLKKGCLSRYRHLEMGPVLKKIIFSPGFEKDLSVLSPEFCIKVIDLVQEELQEIIIEANNKEIEFGHVGTIEQKVGILKLADLAELLKTNRYEYNFSQIPRLFKKMIEVTVSSKKFDLVPEMVSLRASKIIELAQ
jgi:hypothetical protein